MRGNAGEDDSRSLWGRICAGGELALHKVCTCGDTRGDCILKIEDIVHVGEGTMLNSMTIYIFTN